MAWALSIGNFDGVHLGHQALLAELRTFKEAGSGRHLKVITFDPHPVEVLKNIQIPKLSPTPLKIKLLKELGIDDVQVVHFTKEFSLISARDFFENQILKPHPPKLICMGANFFFGHNREGTPQKLRSWGQALNIEVRIAEGVQRNEEFVSSTRIRKLVDEGQIQTAALLLGRPYIIEAPVVKGDARGRLLGFPTANFIPPPPGPAAYCVPKRGVYLTQTLVQGQRYASVTNVGVKPTVSQNQQLTVETHLLDFDGDLYGKQLSVHFLDRLRDEMKFGSIDELKQQIQLDVSKARDRLTAF